jgi:hypothetical protein
MSLHVVPAQQVVSEVPVHGDPRGLQVPPPQRRTPSSSGTHGARSQHCSRIWQTSPMGLQHSGFDQSYPVGQGVPVPLSGGAPKQRGMLFVSSLQTILPLPVKSPGTQQFWEALSPNAPQMLPGGLQLCPFEQVRSFFELGSNSGAVSLADGPSQNTP